MLIDFDVDPSWLRKRSQFSCLCCKVILANTCAAGMITLQALYSKQAHVSYAVVVLETIEVEQSAMRSAA